MNNIISYGWGSNLAIGKFAENFNSRILNNVKANYRSALVVDTTWLGSENIHLVHDNINDNNYDIIILSSTVDATFIYKDDFSMFDTEIIEVGNFPGKNSISFWSCVVSEQFKLQNTNPTKFNYPFICYNNKPHDHRIALHGELARHGLLSKGAVSFNGSMLTSPEDPNNIDFEESGAGESLLNDTLSLGDINIWNQSFINIITETEFNPVSRCFYSEKTWKPIIGLRPFLHYSSDDVNAHLSELGFKTFELEFTDICDLDLSDSSNIALFCSVLSKQSKAYFHDKYSKLLPMLNHNARHFIKFTQVQNGKIANIYTERLAT
jgi:hypothetical protein